VPTWRRKRIFFEKKSFNMQRGKNTKESIFKNQVLESIGSLENPPIVQ